MYITIEENNSYLVLCIRPPALPVSNPTQFYKSSSRSWAESSWWKRQYYRHACYGGSPSNIYSTYWRLSRNSPLKKRERETESTGLTGRNCRIFCHRCVSLTTAKKQPGQIGNNSCPPDKTFPENTSQFRTFPIRPQNLTKPNVWGRIGKVPMWPRWPPSPPS